MTESCSPKWVDVVVGEAEAGEVGDVADFVGGEGHEGIIREAALGVRDVVLKAGRWGRTLRFASVRPYANVDQEETRSIRLICQQIRGADMRMPLPALVRPGRLGSPYRGSGSRNGWYDGMQ